MKPNHTNALVHETSPYLLQHAHNPVDWQAWNPDALQMAKDLDKPILLSIGYSACHWCHVMERESFEDETTARFMNEHFVNIKLDREERPDLDHIYMDAVQAIAGNGGWPLNVFLTTDLKPFYGGTYFPPQPLHQRPSWMQVLTHFSRLWKEKRQEIEAQAEKLTGYLNHQQDSYLKPVPIAAEIFTSGAMETKERRDQCRNMVDLVMKNADRESGGFGHAPKFPQFFTLQFLFQHHYFTGSKEALDQGLLSLDKMLQGGIYDQIGGGLCRYSTDNHWLAPHFEKMLYDNAFLLDVLCDAWLITQDKKYETFVHQVISFLELEMISDGGGFYSALDADSEGEEGRYYVWDKKEVVEVLGEDAELICRYFDVTEKGNWDGRNILRCLKGSHEFLAGENITEEAFSLVLDSSIQKLLDRRATRVKPSLDDKIILSWNAMMLKAVARAALLFKNDRFKEIAKDNFDFIASVFYDAAEHSLLHTHKQGISRIPAFLDDYAYLIEACFSLYELEMDKKFLDVSIGLTQTVLREFSTKGSALLYYTPAESKDVLLRKMEMYDGATSSSNAVMAGNLNKLSVYTENPDWKKRATDMVNSMEPFLLKFPTSFATWAKWYQQFSFGFMEIAVVGDDYLSTISKIATEYLPDRILLGARDSREDIPLLKNKPKSDSTLIFLCQNQVCLEPSTNMEQFLLLKKSLENTWGNQQ